MYDNRSCPVVLIAPSRNAIGSNQKQPGGHAAGLFCRTRLEHASNLVCNMTRFFTIGAVTLAGLLIAGEFAIAAPEHGGERGVERCADGQNISLHSRCAHFTEGMDQNNQAISEQAGCEKSHGGCLSGDDRIIRPVRPPFWIGHHYSGL